MCVCVREKDIYIYMYIYIYAIFARDKCDTEMTRKLISFDALDTVRERGRKIERESVCA